MTESKVEFDPTKTDKKQHSRGVKCISETNLEVVILFVFLYHKLMNKFSRICIKLVPRMVPRPKLGPVIHLNRIMGTKKVPELILMMGLCPDYSGPPHLTLHSVVYRFFFFHNFFFKLKYSRLRTSPVDPLHCQTD